MSSRRDFCSAAVSVGAAAAVPQRAPRRLAPRVEAQGTIFYRQPNGHDSLVRFTGHDIDAPGGRLRVYDSRQRLLGTAAMLKRGDILYGELWLPADSVARVSTVLEAPGLRGGIRNAHRVLPGRRWTLHLATPLDPVDLTNRLQSLSWVRQGIEAALYRKFHATSNPLPRFDRLEFEDHIPFLRSAVTARRLERQFGIPMSSATYFAAGQTPPPTVRLALFNAGVQVVGVERADGNPFQWWRSTTNDGPLVLAVPPGGTSSELAFMGARAEMIRRIERWLADSPLFLSPAYEPAATLVIHDGDVEQLPYVVAAVTEWNARYAYPEIVINQIDLLRSQIVDVRPTDLPVTGSLSDADRSLVQIDSAAVTTMREQAASLRTRQMIAALAGVFRPSEPSLAVVATQVDASRPGTLVFNPSPFPRTDLVQLTDGSSQLATDVPEVGYAYFPHLSTTPTEWTPLPDGRTIETPMFRLTVNGQTGSIASVSSDNVTLVRSPSEGLNALPASRLVRAERFQLATNAKRLIVTRQLRLGTTMKTTITAYDQLPWIDIENVSDSVPDDELSYTFAFEIDNSLVSWEIPGGYEEAPAPLNRVTYLRWLRLGSGDSAVLFRGLDTPVASIDSTGRLTGSAPGRRSRFRIGLEHRAFGPTAPWRFGWQTESMLVTPVHGTSSGVLPRFGSLLTIDRGGIATLALKPADDGRGLILFVQEILGASRSVSVRPGLLGFGRARLVDFSEQDSGQDLAVTRGAISVPLLAWGVAAVRLQDVQLTVE